LFGSTGGKQQGAKASKKQHKQTFLKNLWRERAIESKTAQKTPMWER
jgi:hypothetical protein